MSRTAAPLLGLALAACSSTDAGSAPDLDLRPLAPLGEDAVGPGSAALRTVTTRPLLGTSPRNLLLDPFVTGDMSWGHFVGVRLPVGAPPRAVAPVRSFVSRSPAGVAAPVATLAAAGARGSIQVVAPFPGGSDPFDADVWVSAGNAAGEPVAFETVAHAVHVALLPNDAPATAFPLVPNGAPLMLAGRQWVSLALASPAPLPEGGWFSIAVADPKVSLQVQAPEVTPTSALGPRSLPPRRPRAVHDRAAPGAYVEMLRRLRADPELP
jgi:hypothetical protein